GAWWAAHLRIHAHYEQDRRRTRRTPFPTPGLVASCLFRGAESRRFRRARPRAGDNSKFPYWLRTDARGGPGICRAVPGRYVLLIAISEPGCDRGVPHFHWTLGRAHPGFPAPAQREIR